MTKNLLTALLIAGISATATAATTNYFCELTGHFIVDKDSGARELNQPKRTRPTKWTMAVGQNQNTVSFDGEFWTIFQNIYPISPIHRGRLGSDQEWFYTAEGAAISFYGKSLTFTVPRAGQDVQIFFADCEKF